jgi:hypothetical protein
MTQGKIHLHRFRDRAAVAVSPGAGTLYLDAKAARALAREAARLARSLERETFQESAFGAVEIDGEAV